MTQPDPNATVEHENDTVEETTETQPETEEYETESGSVVTVENGETVVTTRDGSRRSVEGDHYDTVVALATLFPDKF